MLSTQQVSSFHDQGFTVIDFINRDNLDAFRTALYNLILVQLKKRPNLLEKFSANFGNQDYILNDALIVLDREDHSAISHIYDTLTSTSSLLQVVLQKEICEVVNQLLDRPSNSPLYINSVGCRIDPPGDSPFIYGWHHDHLTNTPGSRWVQLWLPAVGTLTKLEGGLEICPHSHKNDYSAQFEKIRAELDSKNPGQIFRIPYHTPFDFQGLDTQYLELKWGQGVLFKEKLLHRSGLNKSTNRVRYCMTTFFHDVYNPNFIYRSPRVQNLNNGK